MKHGQHAEIVTQIVNQIIYYMAIQKTDTHLGNKMTRFVSKMPLQTYLLPPQTCHDCECHKNFVGPICIFTHMAGFKSSLCFTLIIS